MKKAIITIIFLTSTLFASSQVLGYNDLGVIFTQESYRQGTARSAALQNAFGALGGDLSALSINPASGAVFTSSKFSLTVGNKESRIDADYNGMENSVDSGNFNLAQAGGVLVFEGDAGTSSDWNRFSMGINVTKIDNYNGEWRAKGTGNPTWIYDPEDNGILYAHNDYQKYSNFSEGSNTEANFFLSAKYKSNLYLGFSVDSHNAEYKEAAILRERNHDDNNNTVDAYQKFWLNTRADGISFTAGMIYKTTSGLRIGFSYRTPVWYDLVESSNMFQEDNEDSEAGYYYVTYSNTGQAYANNENKQLDYEYKMKTPGRLTGSLAYIFQKKGLISLDVTRKNYSGIRIKPSDEFENENDNFSSALKDVYTLRAGTEWKFDKISLRAGAGFENSPYLNTKDTDNLISYSFGGGYNFGALQLDISYDHKHRTGYYDFYPQYDDLPGAELDINTGNILFTLGYSF